jgi:hypothetical protein
VTAALAADPDFAAQLQRETDRSLRDDPERWVLRRAGEPRDEADRRVSGLRGYVRDAPARRATRDRADDDRWF